MDLALLEEIGLTKSEIKVYLALLELGSSSTGPIVDRSRAASSKIYEVLEKLIQKGLVSFVIKSGVKYFEAADPKRLLDYMKEKKQKLVEQEHQVEKLLPELQLKKTLSKHKNEATVFKGLKGAKTAFDDVLKTLKPGDTYQVFGSMDPNSSYFNFIKHYHRKRSAKKIKLQILYSSEGKSWADEIETLPFTEIKFAPNQLVSSAFVLMYDDKTLISVQSGLELILFRIQNKNVTDSFRSQFALLWNQKTKTYEGVEALKGLFKESLDFGNYDVFAEGMKIVDYLGEDFFLWWQREKKKRKISSRGLIGRKYKNDVTVKNSVTKFKFISEYESPGLTFIFKNRVVLVNFSKHPSAFLIEGKETADNYRSHFELLWNQDTKIVKGLDAVQDLFDEMLEAGHCDFIGARGYFIDHRPTFISNWQARAKKSGFTMRNLVDTETKGHKITKFSFAQTRYTLPIEFSKLSVFWIFGNKVAISNWTKDEPVVVIMDNKEMYHLYKQQFELLWKRKII